MSAAHEPEWLNRLRQAATQRPRTQFTKVRWADVQQLLRERDFLLSQAGAEVQAALADMERHDHGG
jgi:hypothetical protein